MTKRLVYVFIALLLVASACGGSDADTQATDTQATQSTAAATSGDEGSDEPATETTAAPSVESSSGGGNGTATLTLDNGEFFEFSVLCALEPQIAAGQEIVFSVVSYDDPYHFDLTQWGDDSVMNGGADVSVYDSTTFDEVWGSNTSYGHELTLELNGSTITGSGMFVANGDAFGDQVQGEVEANC
jgi:hypothetical protein